MLLSTKYVLTPIGGRLGEKNEHMKELCQYYVPKFRPSDVVSARMALYAKENIVVKFASFTIKLKNNYKIASSK